MARVVKRTRVSKNKKKNWRKHSNIDDVEEYLEEERFNERIGGAVSEKSDDALYFVEKKKKPLFRTADSKVEKRKSILKNLKCFQSLKSTSQVAVPLHPNFVQKRDELKAFLKKRKRKSGKLHQIDGKKSKLDSGVKFYDIWDNDAEGKSLKESELDQDLLNYTKEMTRKKPPKVPVYRYQKPSLLPAVEVPLPGASYNPEFYDHQKLLLEAAKVEQKYEKECRKIERALTEMFPTADQAPTEETWLAEMSQGLDKGNKDEETNENVEQEESGILNPPVSVNKKSKQKKKRELEEKRKRKENIQKKLENKRLHDVYRLRSIRKQLDQLDAISEKRKKIRDKRLVEKMYKPQTLSKYKYEMPLPEFNLTEELTGQLRTVKVEGNILEDRYKSLQRRNIIEPRIKQKRKRKYKIKVLQKRGHRNFDLGIE